MTKNIELLIEKIKNAKSIAISGHKNPDGDSLGSALALMKIIELNFGKKPDVIYDGNIPRFLGNIPLRDDARFYKHIPEDAKYDLYILVDYGTKKNLGGVEKFIEGVDFIIEFDHHYNEDVLGNLCFDDVQKAATSQIIFDIVRKAKLKTDQDVIDLLTLAIITDTGNFKYVRNSTVFKDSADLVEAGANMTHLVNLLSNKDKKTVLVESKAIYKAEFFYKGRLAVAVIKHDDYKKLDGRGEMTLSLLAQIHGVEYVVLLKEQKENQIGVSIRSRQKPINQIAESLGGGGHLCAAGAVMSDSLENVYNKIINVFKGV
jgi:phosphoesterase RecJ-like protein